MAKKRLQKKREAAKAETPKITTKKVQPIKSYEAPILQINDILIGALSYSYRKLSDNDAKLNIIKKIDSLYPYNLDETSYSEKFNIFMWKPKNDIS